MSTSVKWTPQKIEQELDFKENSILTALTRSVQYEAEGFCPVRTGALQEDIKWEVDNNEKVGYVGNDLDYSIYVEYGTRKMMAQPYLRPALDATMQKSDEIISSSIQLD